MALKKNNQENGPNVDERSRRAFLDELEGRVVVSDETPVERKRKVAVQADEVEAPTIAEDKTATRALDKVFKQGGPPTSKKEMGRFDRAPRRKPWGFVILGLVILAAATVSGFIFFSRGTKFSGDQVGLALSLPDNIASGDTVTLTVRYHNDEKVDLKNTEIALEYPDGFAASQSSIEASNDFDSAFTIGTIKRGQVGEFTVSGTITGEVNSTVTFSGNMTYRPVNFNSDFQAQATVDGTIATATLTLAIDGPAKIAPNAAGTWTINYTNSAARELTNVQLAVTLPTGFTLQSTSPKATTAPSTWLLNTLGAGAKGKITLTGMFTGKAGETAELAVSANLVKPGNQVSLQAQTTLLIALVNTGLTVSIGANGETTASAITPGESITYTIKLENKSDAEVNDVTATATLTGTVYDLTKLTDVGSGQLTGSDIVWNKNGIAGLADIQPKDSVTLTFTIPTVVPGGAKTERDLNPAAMISVAISSPNLPTGSAKPTVLITKVNSVLEIKADARYYNDDGDQLGSGPVPPKVGQTTSYRIIWTATNTTSDANSFSASAVLPNNVLWTGQHVSRDAGDINFDPATRTVTWSINKVPGGTGSRYPALTANFEVSITPTADQVGNVVVLSEALNATAVDGSSGKNLTATASSLTTNLPSDPQVGGEGQVIS